MNIINLNCKACGAPLKEKGTETIVCDFCGTTQRVIDMREYFNQMLGYVTSWIKTALPGGIDPTTTMQVDPIARHSIFIHNIQPKLSTEFSQLKFNRINLLATPLIIPPFVLGSVAQKLDDSKNVFLFNAKVKSVESLAINDEHKALTKDMNVCSASYGYAINCIDLLTNEKPGRFQLLAQNFKAMADELASAKEHEAEFNRMMGLHCICIGIESLLNGEIENAQENINRAIEMLNTAVGKVSMDFDLSVTLSAIEQELAVARCVLTMINIAKQDPTGPLHCVRQIENLLRNVATYNAPTPKWNIHFANLKRYEEIMMNLSLVLRAKGGESTINICGGSGNILVPFWIVYLDYTFSTGALFLKKGRVVTDTLLLAATFPIDNRSWCGEPERVVTDIFTPKLMPTIASITGRETKVSAGSYIQQLLTTSSLRSASGMAIIPPISTKNEADDFIDDYRARKEVAFGGKVKIVADRIGDIVYVSATRTQYGVDFSQSLGTMAPVTLGDPLIISKIIL